MIRRSVINERGHTFMSQYRGGWAQFFVKFSSNTIHNVYNNVCITDYHDYRGIPIDRSTSVIWSQEIGVITHLVEVLSLP